MTTMDMTTSFVGGDGGSWAVTSMQAITGPPLPTVKAIDVVQASMPDVPSAAKWVLRGVASYERYVNRAEHNQLVARQEGLGRPEATEAVLIPITKSAEWWSLMQDERREILEERSHHIEIGLDYLPAIARKLYHGRELGEPFDFLTWFEFAPKDAGQFDDLLAQLRASKEWTFVEREVEIRLTRAAAD